MDNASGEQQVLEALAPVVEAVGAEFMDIGQLIDSDVPIEWRDRIIGGVRLPVLHGSLDRLLRVVERELGGSISELTREQQHVAIGRLDELGAFTLRRAVEDIAGAIGISRFTVY